MNEVSTDRAGLTPSERRFLKSCSRYRLSMVAGFVILAVVSVVWMRHYRLLAPNPFVLTYNVVVYGSLVASSFFLAWRDRRTYKLVVKILNSDDPSRRAISPQA